MGKLSKMKLLFSMAVVFISLGFTAGSYGQAFVYLSSTQDESVAVGEQMHLNIQIWEGRSVSGYEMIVAFNSTALRYIESANADYLPAGAFAVPPVISDNTVYIAATSPAGPAPTSEGTLAKLTFEVMAAKNSTIQLIGVTLSDSAGMPLAVTARSGYIVATELPTNWDINEDGKVNILDLTLVASSFNADVLANPRVDVNRDGQVNILDLVLVAQSLDAIRNKPEVRVQLKSVPLPDRLTPTVISGTVRDGDTDVDSEVINNAGITVIGGTVRDGDTDVDSEVINNAGTIEIIFSEKVSGNIALQTEGGDDIGWLGKVEGNKGVLELVKGKEISNGTTYVIICLVTDAAGNRAKIRNVFVTKHDNDERGDLVEEDPIVQASKVSFKDDIQPILAERCAFPGCHAAPGVVGLALSKYDTFKKGGVNGPAFDPGNGKGSLVVKRIDGGGMPPGGPPLDGDQIQLFIDWINQGAKDN